MSENDTAASIKVWDICLRLFHWSLAVLFVLSAYSAFQDKFGVYADMHFLAGYTTLILVVWRIMWGLVGSDTARFSRFVASPAAAMRHLTSMLKGDPYQEVGHSALAGYSILLMLVLLLTQALMGLFASDGMIFSGPLSNEVSSSLRSDLTTWHKLLGRILIGLVCLHVLAIVAYAAFKRVNLVWPMIVGKRRAAEPTAQPQLKPAWLGLLCFVAAGAVVCTAVFVL